MIGAAVLICTAAGCASTPKPRPKEQVYQLNGHRLKVNRDDAGLVANAKAFDKDGKEIPTAVIPTRDVKVCTPKALAAESSPSEQRALAAEAGPSHQQAGPDQHCEPLLYMPYDTFFKTGTNSWCYLYQGTTVIKYWCPP
jgi:hypothetical protein